MWEDLDLDPWHQRESFTDVGMVLWCLSCSLVSFCLKLKGKKKSSGVMQAQSLSRRSSLYDS